MAAASQPLSGLIASSGGAPGVQVILVGAVLVVVVALLLLVARRTHNRKGRRSAAAVARPSDRTTTAGRYGGPSAPDRSLSPSFSSTDKGPANRGRAAVPTPRAPLAPVPTPTEVVEPAAPPAVPVFDRSAARALGPAGGRAPKPTAPTTLPLLSVPPPPAADDRPG
jgi:hypothetical protein